MKVNMTDEKSVQLFATVLGGAAKKQAAPQKPHWKQQWRWEITGKKARAAYAVLEPFLRLKRIKLRPVAKTGRPRKLSRPCQDQLHLF
jgi:hypothetical protein